MKTCSIILSLIFGTLFTVQVKAQTHTVEALENQLENTEVAVDRVDLLNELAYELRSKDYDKAILYATEAYDLSRNNNYNYGLVSALSNWGLIYQYKGEYDKSLQLTHLREYDQRKYGRTMFLFYEFIQDDSDMQIDQEIEN